MKLIDIKRREMLSGLSVAGASFALVPGFSKAQGKNHLKTLMLSGTSFVAACNEVGMRLC